MCEEQKEQKRNLQRKVKKHNTELNKLSFWEALKEVCCHEPDNFVFIQDLIRRKTNQIKDILYLEDHIESLKIEMAQFSRQLDPIINCCISKISNKQITIELGKLYGIYAIANEYLLTLQYKERLNKVLRKIGYDEGKHLLEVIKYFDGISFDDIVSKMSDKASASEVTILLAELIKAHFVQVNMIGDRAIYFVKPEYIQSLNEHIILKDGDSICN